MIIVEGFDNSGKTTLVRQLSEDCKLLVMNNRRRPKSREDVIDYVDMVIPIANRFPVILDRFAPISEPIYGPICRDSHLLTEDDVSQCLLSVARNRRKHQDGGNNSAALIIYCRPKDSTVLGFKPEIPQMDGVIEKAQELLMAYDKSMKELGSFWFTVVHYDWELDSYNSIKNLVSQHFQNYAN